MNDFGGFDLDSFVGNGYQRPNGIQQQPQQRYSNSSRGPAMDNYDPNRIANPLQMGPYNSTASGGGGTATATHRTLMPASTGPLAAPPGTVNGLPSHAHHHHHQQQQVRGIPDFEPLPLSATALQRMVIPGHHHHHHQQSAAAQLQAKAPPPGHSNSNGIVNVSRGSSMASGNSAALASFYAAENSYTSSQKNSNNRQPQQQQLVAKPPIDPWLEELRLTVSELALEPMSGTDVLGRLETRSQEVITRYLPCVDFLVQCQQELRKGLAAATLKRSSHHMFRDAMTPRQFYNTYIATLPERFYRKNRRTMKPEDLDAAVKELQTLCANARGAERQGCEVVKNTFLGGMKDGESWGLRKWLSKHGGALYICNDSECILHSCQKLDRSLDSTRKLGEKLRPIAKKALARLKADVPSSYQEHSTAHPYLPFFHRLEAALKGMSNFDPEDDDVICIDDDDEVEELKVQKPPPQPEKKRKPKKATIAPARPPAKKPRSEASSSSDEDSIIEILDTMAKSPANSKKPDLPIDTNDDMAYMQELLKTFDDDVAQSDFFGVDPDFDSIALTPGGKKDASELAAGIDRLATVFDSNQAALVRPANIAPINFWDEAQKYANALRMFSELLRNPDSLPYLESVSDEETVRMGNPPYSNIIRHPLGFRDIVSALMEETDDMAQNVTSKTGQLMAGSLDEWNMWRGYDLLQAIDLVLLNSLAYGKAVDQGRSSERSKTNKLRKSLWASIKCVIDSHIAAYDQEEKRRCTPTRRGEGSGFIVFKGN